MVSVVIIGAGAAGLTAAYDLIRSGQFNVTVLEANSYIGGRVKKVPSGFADFPIDAGGEWVQHKDGHGILERILDHGSPRLDKIEVIPYRPDFKYSENMGKTFENNNYFATDEPYFHFVNYTWFDFFNDFIAPTSKKYTNFKCIVNAIDYSVPSQPVNVHCSDGRTFQGDYVILAVPLSVLQHPANLTFVPALPANKLNALGKVLMTPGVKIFLKFKEKFYYDAFQLEYQDTFYNERFYYDATYGQESDDNILGVFLLGEEATKAFEGQSKEDIGHQNALFEEHIHDESDRHYERVIEVFRSPVDRVYSAGEYVPIDDWEGYVHGAALSGRAAASKVQSAVSAAVAEMSPSFMIVMLLGSVIGTIQLIL